MTVRSWRALLLSFCACCIAVNAISLFTDDVEASSALGFQVDRVADPALALVIGVDRNGAAAASGLRTGDLIHLRSLSSADRYRLLTGVYPHERIPIVVSRGARTMAIEFKSGAAPAWRWDIVLWCAASFWLLGFATFLAWRRADSVEARVLCALLALYPAGSGFQQGSWLTPSPFADMLAAIVGGCLVMASAALLATYASLFARPLSFVRIILTASTYAAAAAISVYDGVRLVLLWNGGMPWVAQSYAPDWNFPWEGIVYVLASSCALAAVATSRGEERDRIAWSTGTLAILYIMQPLAYFLPLVMPSAQRGGELVLSYELFNLSSFLAPLGMTYALLNRRLLDVGFALNRAAIFSGVSIVLVGTFILAEWLLSTWLQGASHSANLAVAAALALALGLSIRFVQTRVEHVVDNVFFRKRRQDEDAIHTFAREAAYITERSVLLERTKTLLFEHADASFEHILLDDGAGSYSGVDENDPALVALRARHGVLDLHALQTHVDGEFAYAMVARGRLIGALVLGAKRSGESYAPDESKAIEQLAHSVGGALDVLAMREQTSREDVLQEIRLTTSALYTAVQTLTETVHGAMVRGG